MEITSSTENIMSAVYMIGSSVLFRSILSVFIGVLVDRFNKKNLAIVSNINSILVVVLLVLFFGKIQKSFFLGIFLILLNDINNEVFLRSSMLISSEIFDKETFIKFQAKYSAINRIVIIAGSSIIGFLIAVLSYKAILVIAILSFVISGLLIFSIEYISTKEIKEVELNFFQQEISRLVEDVKYMAHEIRTNKLITRFILIMFILNLAYGYIPYILPIKISTESVNPIMLGLIKSTISIGEIIGLVFISRFGEKVSTLFKISMLGNATIMIFLGVLDSFVLICFCFFLYGILDSLTQPFFSYTVSMIDEKNRGKILGGIDALILLSPSLGMFFLSKIMEYSKLMGYYTLASIFIVSYVIMCLSFYLKNINLRKE